MTLLCDFVSTIFLIHYFQFSTGKSKQKNKKEDSVPPPALEKSKNEDRIESLNEASSKEASEATPASTPKASSPPIDEPKNEVDGSAASKIGHNETSNHVEANNHVEAKETTPVNAEENNASKENSNEPSTTLENGTTSSASSSAPGSKSSSLIKLKYEYPEGTPKKTFHSFFRGFFYIIVVLVTSELWKITSADIFNCCFSATWDEYFVMPS